MSGAISFLASEQGLLTATAVASGAWYLPRNMRAVLDAPISNVAGVIIPMAVTLVGASIVGGFLPPGGRAGLTTLIGASAIYHATKFTWNGDAEHA